MSMPYIIWHSALFDGKNRAESEDTILKLLAVLVDRNCQYLRAHPNTPKLYDSGCVYALPDQMTRAPDEAKLLRLVSFLKNEMGADEEIVDIITTVLHGCEIFRDIPTILEKKAIDCFPLTQKIIVRSRSTGMYELLAIGDLRHVYPYYEALSYNFSKSRYEFRAIVGFVDKGEKQVSCARLSNGTDLISTDSHTFWSLDGQRQSDDLSDSFRIGQRTMGEYVETYQDWKTGKISKGQRGRRSRILQAAKIPALGTVHVPPAQAYLAGMYAAEGWKQASTTRIGQHKQAVRMKIEHALTATNTSFSYSPGRGATPGSGAEYRLLDGGKHSQNPIVRMMREQGDSSFNKQLPQALLSADAETIALALEGHGDGDAWRPGVGDSHYERSNISAIYATSSDMLMEQLRLGSLILGRSTYIYHQKEHQGEGHSPIWRLHEYNEHASKLKARKSLMQEMVPGLTFGTVRNARPFGKAHVGCIEVEGNHNFFLADGTLVSNCDNLACFRVAELRVGGVEAVPYIIWRETPRGTTYHALLRWPDGTSEDPSILLGMGGEAKAAERAEEKRKNKERYSNMIAAAHALCAAGETSIREAGKRIDALGLLPKSKSW